MSGGSTGSIAEDLKIVNKELETVKAQLFASTGFSQKETEEYERQIEALNKVKASLAEKARSQGMNAKAQEAIALSAKKEVETQEKNKATAEEIAKINDRYKSARSEVIGILQSEKTEYQLIQEQIDKLQASPWEAGQLEKDRLAALEVLRARQQEIRVEELEASEATALAIRDAEWAAQDEAQAKKTAAHEQYLAELEAEAAKEKENKEKYAQLIRDRITIAQGMAAQLISIFNQIYQNELITLDQRYNADLERINNSTMNEEEKAAAIEELEQNLAIEKAKIARKQAEIEKASSLVNIAISTYEAIIKAYAQLGPIGGSIAAAVIGTLGAVQAGLVLSQPLPEIPSFADGGSFMVPPGFDGDNFPITTAFAKSGERVTVETPSQQAAGRGITLQVGVLVADESGLRELDKRLRDVGSFEDLRRGL